MTSSLPPTAIFITDPMVAVGAVNEAREFGIEVPRDLSVLAFDDTDVRNNVSPTLTAVCQDARQLGYEAFSTLAGIISAEEDQKSVQRTLPAWLEFNQTTAPPPPSPDRVLPDGTRRQRGHASPNQGE